MPLPRLLTSSIAWALLAGALPGQVVTTELLAGDPQADAWFGSAVALHGDTAVVGAERYGASFGTA